MKTEKIKFIFIGVLFMVSLFITIDNFYKTIKKEGFKQIMYGVYPDRHSDPLLADSYKRKNFIEPSQLTVDDLEKYKPRTPMCSYKQVTNNFRYWETPNNGECKPAAFCNAYYEKKEHKIRGIEIPKNNNKRVNFFNYNMDKTNII